MRDFILNTPSLLALTITYNEESGFTTDDFQEYNQILLSRGGLGFTALEDGRVLIS